MEPSDDLRLSRLLLAFEEPIQVSGTLLLVSICPNRQHDLTDLRYAASLTVGDQLQTLLQLTRNPECKWGVLLHDEEIVRKASSNHLEILLTFYIRM